MGIPFYFKSIVTQFPNTIKAANSNTQCTQFYLDFNCIIHNAAAKVCKKTFVNLSDMYNEVVDEAFNYTTYLVRAANPKQLVYVAVDGPCPRAKMHQQRKRRFISSWRTQQLHTPYSNASASWDSNAVTPGTDFMKLLDDRLPELGNAILQHVSKCVISNSTEFGEGEQKIFRHLREFPSNQQSQIIIYGLDADLILLSIISGCNIRLLREQLAFGQHHNNNSIPTTALLLLDVYLLKSYITQCITNNTVANDAIMIDYVFMCSLIGNDFIPPISCMKIKRNFIEILISAYTTACLKKGVHLVSFDQQHINLQALHDILYELSQSEDKYMIDASQEYYAQNAKPNQTPESRIDNFPVIHKYPYLIDPSSSGWRFKWYHHLFGDHSIQCINTTCNKYLQGMYWVFAYYFQDKHNNAWFYPYNYSPTIVDLVTHINMIIHDGTEHTLVSAATQTDPMHKYFSTTISPELQLLMVLPPQSMHLVRPRLQECFTNPALGVCHYYPCIFEISTYLKTYLWECSAVLPIIDYDRLLKVYTLQSK